MKLNLNKNKCRIMKISKRNLIKDQQIEGINLVKEIKVLGFVFDGFNGFKT